MDHFEGYQLASAIGRGRAIRLSYARVDPVFALVGEETFGDLDPLCSGAAQVDVGHDVNIPVRVTFVAGLKTPRKFELP